jgi:hypothetical protein
MNLSSQDVEDVARDSAVNERHVAILMLSLHFFWWRVHERIVVD